MNKIPTAEEFLKSNHCDGVFLLKNMASPDGIEGNHYERVKKAMVEFAKLHVKYALKVASKKAETKSRKKTYKASSGTEYGYKITVDKKSILNSYLLTNIE